MKEIILVKEKIKLDDIKKITEIVNSLILK